MHLWGSWGGDQEAVCRRRGSYLFPHHHGSRGDQARRKSDVLSAANYGLVRAGLCRVGEG